MRELEAHESLGFISWEVEVAAAWLKALAICTEVSLTAHLVGLGGSGMVRGAESVALRACSRCLRRAKRTSAGSSWLSSAFSSRGSRAG